MKSMGRVFLEFFPNRKKILFFIKFRILKLFVNPSKQIKFKIKVVLMLITYFNSNAKDGKYVEQKRYDPGCN